MADISMCKKHNCERKSNCYRYKAKPNNYWQPYFHFDYEKDPTCFYPIEQNEKILN